ncbi:DNA adenine methylase [Rufibacter sp. H-1]|uniref:DNA adenine methylase n=2 Tax=Rufibacter sediminis TaxID=2762756 RepID=A0ABR6VU07_9BACT|nr:DNA adenine methylase [Rufibacter sediminis]
MFETEITPAKPGKNKIVNVASVPQRSPFRYPGGKTWLIPTVRQWLKQDGRAVSTLVEPFAGGGIVSLTAAFENLANQVIMAELDPEIAAVWQTIISDDNQWLAERILQFELNIDNVNAAINMEDKQTRDHAFSTVLKNRIYHGGIIAKGSGPLKNGENGKGIASRWYAKTLFDRITAIQQVRGKITFNQEDAFDVLTQYRDREDFYFFIDPPYTKAGKRLYTFFDIDHARLFEYVSLLRGKFMLTYDDTPEIRGLADRFGLPYKIIPMKTTHHLEKNEILVSDNLDW